jgi:hypothetical protein
VLPSPGAACSSFRGCDSQAGIAAPALTRSTIRRRSSSATAPRTVKTILPAGVEVSICSENETKSIPNASNVSNALSKWETDRAKRSNRQTQTPTRTACVHLHGRCGFQLSTGEFYADHKPTLS